MKKFIYLLNLLPILSLAQVTNHENIKTQYWPVDTYEDSRLSDELIEGFSDGLFFHVLEEGKNLKVEKRDLNGKVVDSKTFPKYQYKNLSVSHLQSVTQGGKIYEFYSFNKQAGLYNDTEGNIGLVVRDESSLNEISPLKIIAESVIFSDATVLKRESGIYLDIRTFEYSELLKVSYEGNKEWAIKTGAFLKGENSVKYFNIQDDGNIVFAVSVRDARVLQNFLRSEKVKPGILVVYIIDKNGKIKEFIPEIKAPVYSTVFFHYLEESETVMGVSFAHNSGKNNYQYPQNTAIQYYKWDVNTMKEKLMSKKMLTYDLGLGIEGKKFISEAIPKLTIEGDKLYPMIAPKITGYDINSKGELTLVFADNGASVGGDPDLYKEMNASFNLMKGQGVYLIKFDTEGNILWTNSVPHFTYVFWLDDRPFVYFVNDVVYIAHPESIACWKSGSHKYTAALAKKAKQSYGVISKLNAKTGELVDKTILSRKDSKMGIDATMTQVSSDGTKLYLFLSASAKLNQMVTFEIEE
jgi:hypothetical protein